MSTYIPISSIVVGDRQRKQHPAAEHGELLSSILEVGLLHAISVQPTEDGHYRLLTGERRLRAITELHERLEQCKYGQENIPANEIPAIILEPETLSLALRIELAENDKRKDLTWEEKVFAIHQIHEAFLQENPKHKKQDTQRELEEINKAQGNTDSLPPRLTTQALVVAAAIKENKTPALTKAKSIHEAYTIVVDESDKKFQAELARRNIARNKDLEYKWHIEHADSRSFLPNLEANSVDLFLFDPPYGISIDKMHYPAQALHTYKDSPEYAYDLAQFLLQEGWQIGKQDANLFAFCSYDLWKFMHDAAARMGWSAWHRPIIWVKGKEGEAPWGRKGFIYTHEYIFYATKNQKGIKGAVPDVITEFRRVPPTQRLHPAEKPVDLLMYLINLATDPFEVVCDPCVGSGPVIEAALRSRRQVIGCEISREHCDTALARINRVVEELKAEKENVS